MKLVNHLDFQKLEARNMVLSVLGTAPSTPSVGQGYYDSGLLGPRWWTGTTFANGATDSLLLNGQNAAYYLNRANFTGTQLSSTISDLVATIQAQRLDQMAAPTTVVSMNSNRLTNLANPIAAQDAATMSWVTLQVQTAQAGIDSKPAVRLATTSTGGNITLSGLQSIDGVTTVAGDRVLVKNQTTASANGVYIAGSGSWTRANTDGSYEATLGAFWYVEEGSTQAKTQWQLQNTGTITVGTTALTINQFGASNTYTAGNGISLTGNVFAAVAAASGGLTVGASGIALDTTIAARKYSTTIGDGSSISFTVTHNLGTQDVIVSVRDTGTNLVELADVTASSTTAVTVGFGTAPAANGIRVTVLG